jgi:transketolase
MAQMKALRDAFGETLVELGRENDKIVVLSADLEDSTKAEYFKKEFPDRFFTLGIAEQDMVGNAAGLALAGFIPFAASFAVFLTNQAYGITRIMACYNNLNVKLVSTHAGLTVGEDGATAQSLEDIAIMRVLPRMTVISPCDALETAKAMRAVAAVHGPAYIRLSRAEFPIITESSTGFEIGKANVMRQGNDAAIIACGLMVSASLEAADELAAQGIKARVINMHTIKPLDREAVIRAAKECGAVVTAEEHQIYGGLGGAVAECLAAECPVPQEFVAVKDSFGESGKPSELLAKYGLTAKDIVAGVNRAIARKKK